MTERIGDDTDSSVLWVEAYIGGLQPLMFIRIWKQQILTYDDDVYSQSEYFKDSNVEIVSLRYITRPRILKWYVSHWPVNW